MKAMVLERISAVRDGSEPLRLADLPTPVPGDRQLLIRVAACAVCHTELDEIEGRTPPPRLPVVPGHQVVGRVESLGKGVRRFKPGDRVGVGWIYSACGKCRFCLEGKENLCADFRATGRDVDGGYAEYMVVPEDFAFPIPGLFSDIEAAPLLCAGAIGYRSLRLANLGRGATLGLTGFGASGHLVLKLARHTDPARRVFVFARSERERQFAKQLGADWVGDTRDIPPEPLSGIIDTTPAWLPVVEALKRLEPGGRLVVNAMRKEDADKEALLTLEYPSHLWLEKELKSVANVTREDISQFLAVAAAIPLKPEVEELGLADANRALVDVKRGSIRGAKVLSMA
jgi:alcohol dehydrogenase, propanol-preferring